MPRGPVLEPHRRLAPSGREHANRRAAAPSDGRSAAGLQRTVWSCPSEVAELEEHYEPHPIAGIEALGRAATGGATHSRVPPPRHPALEEGNRRSGVVEKAPVVEVNHDRYGRCEEPARWWPRRFPKPNPQTPPSVLIVGRCPSCAQRRREGVAATSTPARSDPHRRLVAGARAARGEVDGRRANGSPCAARMCAGPDRSMMGRCRSRSGSMRSRHPREPQQLMRDGRRPSRAGCSCSPSSSRQCPERCRSTRAGPSRSRHQVTHLVANVSLDRHGAGAATHSFVTPPRQARDGCAGRPCAECAKRGSRPSAATPRARPRSHCSCVVPQ